MRTNYFDRLIADKDDASLYRHIALGTVPSGCLLGGVMIDELSTSGVDPCSQCNGPRDRCGGRQKAVDLAPTPPPRGEDSAAYRRLMRKRFVAKLNEIAGALPGY